MFGKELSETLRERIIGSYLSGIKQCIISEELGVPKNTVNDTIKRYKKTGSAHLKNAQVIQKCLPNAIHELYNVLLNSSLNTNFHHNTVRKYLHNKGLGNYTAQKKPLLTRKQRKDRLRWSKDKKNW
uniref:Transposase Tc1-like domain-containing protein n=1 Tax=Rhizophagus irregularis (strain DAOM 181602 / DAOM 197198 / MUCL 43194) TaxID=747089 RepID=U9TK19_RHIID